MRQGSSQLRYVGSPYQTSLSEAGQVKYLYDMSCEPIEGSSNDSNQRTWQEKERWAIDVGKKYFKVTSSLKPEEFSIVMCMYGYLPVG